MGTYPLLTKGTILPFVNRVTESAKIFCLKFSRHFWHFGSENRRKKEEKNMHAFSIFRSLLNYLPQFVGKIMETTRTKKSFETQ